MKTKIQLTTAIGYLMYSSLQAPSYGTKKYPKKDGEFKTDILLDTRDTGVKKFLKEFQGHLDSLGNTEKCHLKALDKPVEGLDDPKYYIKLTLKTNYKWKNNEGEEVLNKIHLLDANGGGAFTKEEIIGNLTKAQICFDLIPFSSSPYGCLLSPKAVMIHELVPYKPVDADSFGFSYNEDTAEEQEDPDEVPVTVSVGGEKDSFNF